MSNFEWLWYELLYLAQDNVKRVRNPFFSSCIEDSSVLSTSMLSIGCFVPRAHFGTIIPPCDPRTHKVINVERRCTVGNSFISASNTKKVIWARKTGRNKKSQITLRPTNGYSFRLQELFEFFKKIIVCSEPSDEEHRLQPRFRLAIQYN